MVNSNSSMLQSQLIDFVIKESGISNYKIQPNTRLFHDLGIDGDDGVEFMISYGQKFNVDLSNFMADKYFEPEGLQFINGLFEKLGIRKSKHKPLHVKDLQKGIELGYLNEEIISVE